MALKALNEAKKHHKLIAIDVSDPSLVKRCKDDLKKIVEEFADILFSNEDEAKALTNKEAEDALNELGALADIVIVKIGKEGSLVNDHGVIHMI